MQCHGRNLGAASLRRGDGMLAGNWFEWNGARSDEYGISVLKYPDIILPKERIRNETIYGRSGSLTRLEGKDVREDYLASIECMLDDTSRIVSVDAWLRGGGKLVTAEMPNVYVDARVYNQIAIVRMFRALGLRKFPVQFRCQPYFYHLHAPVLTLTSAGTVYNPGLADAEPVMTVTGRGTITLGVGSQLVTLRISTGGVRSVVLDVPRMECYELVNGVPTNRNNWMQGVFPKLAPGNNAISWELGTGASLTSLTIDTHWRD